MSFPSIEQVDAYIERIRTDYTFSRDNLEKKYSWKRNDSRIVVFTKGIRVMNAIQIGVSHLRKDLKHDEWWKNRYPQDNITPENKRSLCDDFDNFLRNALINDVYGIFESTIRILAPEFSSKIFPDSTIMFSKIYPKLLKELELEKFIPLLQIWSNIRNSIHNDGMFVPPKSKAKDEDLVYDGGTYMFRVGKPVICTGWKDLCELSYELGKATHQIITSPKIVSITFIEEPGSKYWNLKNIGLEELKKIYSKDSEK